MGTCLTVTIKSPKTTDNPAGLVVINASDYDPNQHELADGKDAGAGESGVKQAKKAKHAGAGEQ